MSKAADKAIQNAAEVIERFGGIRPMAKKIEVAVTTVQGWKKRDVIPAARRDQIVEAAVAHDVDLSDILGDAPEAASANENNEPAEATESVDPVDEKSDEASDMIAESAAENSEDTPVILNKEAAADVAAVSASAAPQSEELPSEEPPKATPAPSDSDPFDEAERARLEKQLAEAEKRAVTKSILITAVLVALGVIAIVLLIWPQKQDEARLEVLQQNVSEMQQDVDGVKTRQSFFGTLIPEDLNEQISSLKEQAGRAQEQIGQVVIKAQQISSDVLSEDAGSMDQRIVKLEQHVSEIVGSPVLAGFIEKTRGMASDMDGQGQLESVMEMLAALSAQSQAVQANPEQGGIAAEIAAIEGDEGALDEQEEQEWLEDHAFENMLAAARSENAALAKTFEGVPTQDLKAAAMLLGMSQFRKSLNRDGRPFEDDLQVLMNLIGEDNQELRAAIERLAPHAKDGVLTPDGLGSEFKSLAGDAVVASLSGEDVSVQERASARFNDVFQVEKNGELITGTETQGALLTGKKDLESGDIAGAIAAVEELDGPAATVMQPWLEKAKASLHAQKLNELLEQIINIEAYGAPEDALQSVQQQLHVLGGGSGELVTDEEAGIYILVPDDSAAAPKVNIKDANPFDDR